LAVSTIQLNITRNFPINRFRTSIGLYFWGD